MSTYDLIVIGGGVNGAGIARDAAGRGLKVLLLEKDDLAEATSSRSTKLFHGGLRYLEFFKFRLVRESLMEREVLWRAMPHIAWPLRFVLPLDPAMRFPEDTPAARLLGMAVPWLKGRRPNWMIRLGLFAYDHMGGRKDLPATRSLDLAKESAGQGLSTRITRAFEYSDVWVDDARLVLLNARDAALRGATIRTRTEALGARRTGAGWDVTFRSADGTTETAHASLLVNAAGPWVASLIESVIHTTPPAQIRLVRGSHIITRRLFTHDRAYFFQGEDGRIIFAIPYEGDFTLIGTTDVEHRLGEAPVISEAERDYLIAFANRYLRTPISAEDIVWTYSGVRPLYDDGASSATAATRDYVLHLDRGQSGAEAPVLSVFGGKITTYRRLAEAALAKLGSADARLASGAWTRGAPLPGGDFAPETLPDLAAHLCASHPWLSTKGAARLIRAYGTEAPQVLGTDPGQIFGADLSEAELRWMREKEWARTAEDALWRRSKLGLHLPPEEIAAVARWFEEAQT